VDSNDINIALNLNNYISKIDFKTEANEMTPGTHALSLSKHLANSFKIIK
jgi:hypothetical protein